eukprot:gene10877-12091_t
MSLLSRLPQDITFFILQEWLGDWKSISSLDIAFCQRNQDFLSALRHESLTLEDIEDSDDGNEYDRVIHKLGHNSGLCINFLRWVQARGIKLEVFYVWACQLPTVANYLTDQTFPTVQKVSIMSHGDHEYDDDEYDAENEGAELAYEEEEYMAYNDIGDTEDDEGSHSSYETIEDWDEEDGESGDSDDTVVNPAHFRTILHAFPNMTEMDCAEFRSLSDNHLDQILSLEHTLPLKVLNFYACEHISWGKVVQVALLYQNSLEDLWCDVLVDEALVILSGACKKLKFVGIACESMSNESLIQFFSHYPEMEEIRLDQLALFGENNANITDDVVLSITQSCSKLVAIEVNHCESVSINSIHHVVQNCPRIHTLIISGIEIQINSGNGSSNSSSDGKGEPLESDKYCDIHISEQLMSVDDVKPLLQHCWLPVHSITTSRDIFPFDRSILHLIADNHGSTLIELHCQLNNDEVDEEDLDYLLSRCPKMLGLVFFQCNMMTDHIFLRLKEYCPGIITLGVDSAYQLTDDAVITVLQQFSSNRLEGLIFDFCSQLSDKLLVTIVQCAPYLFELDIRGTCMTKEGMLKALLLVPHFAATVGGFSEEDSDWIHEELRKAGQPTRVEFLEQ